MNFNYNIKIQKNSIQFESNQIKFNSIESTYNAYMVFFCFVSKHHDGANFFILFLHIQHSDILIRLFVVNMVINFIWEWKKNNSTHTHLNMKKCEKDIVIIMYPYMAILVIIVAKEMEK
mgnify:CR=1 FL=1